eukprot:4682001-Pyramimonas_sp.AAC.1
MTTGTCGAATVDGAGKQRTPNANGVLEAVPAHARLAYRKRLRQKRMWKGSRLRGLRPSINTCYHRQVAV